MTSPDELTALIREVMEYLDRHTHVECPFCESEDIHEENCSLIKAAGEDE